MKHVREGLVQRSARFVVREVPTLEEVGVHVLFEGEETPVRAVYAHPRVLHTDDGRADLVVEIRRQLVAHHHGNVVPLAAQHHLVRGAAASEARGVAEETRLAGQFATLVEVQPEAGLAGW